MKKITVKVHIFMRIKFHIIAKNCLFLIEKLSFSLMKAIIINIVVGNQIYSSGNQFLLIPLASSNVAKLNSWPNFLLTQF